MVSLRASVTILTFSLFAGGCTSESVDFDSETELSDLQLELEQGQDFEIEAREDAGEFVAKGVWLEQYTAFPMDIAGGNADVQLVDGALMLSELVIEVSGLAYELPGGSELNEMVLVLEEPTELEAEWTEDNLISQTNLKLRLDWWVETDDGMVPLASQTVQSIPVELRIEDDGQGLRLDATIQQEGAVLSLDSALDVQKFDVSLSGLSSE